MAGGDWGESISRFPVRWETLVRGPRVVLIRTVTIKLKVGHVCRPIDE